MEILLLVIAIFVIYFFVHYGSTILLFVVIAALFYFFCFALRKEKNNQKNADNKLSSEDKTPEYLQQPNDSEYNKMKKFDQIFRSFIGTLSYSVRVEGRETALECFLNELQELIDKDKCSYFGDDKEKEILRLKEYIEEEEKYERTGIANKEKLELARKKLDRLVVDELIYKAKKGGIIEAENLLHKYRHIKDYKEAHWQERYFILFLQYKKDELVRNKYDFSKLSDFCYGDYRSYSSSTALIDALKSFDFEYNNKNDNSILVKQLHGLFMDNPNTDYYKRQKQNELEKRQAKEREDALKAAKVREWYDYPVTGDHFRPDSFSSYKMRCVQSINVCKSCVHKFDRGERSCRMYNGVVFADD